MNYVTEGLLLASKLLAIAGAVALMLEGAMALVDRIAPRNFDPFREPFGDVPGVPDRSWPWR